MKRLLVPAVLLVSVTFIVAILAVGGAAAELNSPLIETNPARIYTSRNTSSGKINTSNLGVFGSHQISSFGDPYSPQDPNWPDWYLDSALNHQGLDTYHFLIAIPADYPSDVVRVELFDPDSINKLNSEDTDGSSSTYTASVVHTDAWIGNVIEQLSCSSTNWNPCLIDTGEDEYLDLPLDQVNPWWFVRIDENRFYGGAPSTYSPQNNTRTEYELFYYANRDDSTIDRITLANYVGQVGDGIRDYGDHDTDMRWVSPGAPLAFDQAVYVPAGAQGTVASFEINLNSDVPNIQVDPATGERILHLDVTALDGSSENGFEIWAGPPDYVDSVPSDVNLRNVLIINNPGAHDSQGITIYASGTVPINFNYHIVDMPLTYVPAENAGGKLLVSLFDPDSGSQPPITFYFDTIAFTPDNSENRYDETLTDWALAFEVAGVTDPDHADWLPDYDTNGRCVIGTCQNTWINPPFLIQIPTYDADACAANPDNQAVCTPFYGGRLMAYYGGGMFDTHAWRIDEIPLTIAPESVTIDGPTTGTVDTAHSFTAITSPITTTLPLTYTWEAMGQTAVNHTSGLTDIISFNWAVTGPQTITVTHQNGISATHTINIEPPLPAPANLTIGELTLLTESPITAYEPVTFQMTISNTGDVAVNQQFFVDLFLDPTEVYATNIPIGQSDGYTAVTSLTAHDSQIITITAPTGFANEPTEHQVYAMVDSLEQIAEGSETDNISDPFTINDVTPISPYITLLPDCGTGPNVQLTVMGFNWPPNKTISLYWDDILESTVDTGSSSSFSQTWQMLGVANGSHEVKAVDDGVLAATAVFNIPCQTPPGSVTISGPATAFLNTPQSFTATVSPLTAAQPLTYTWQATGQPTISQTGGISHTIDYTWTITGTKTITLTVQNNVGTPVTTTHTVPVVKPYWCYLPVMLKEE